MIELPFLGVGDVDVGEHGLDDAPRQVGVTGHTAALDRKPRFVLDRPLVGVGHAHAVSGHVVHEEIGKVLGGDDDQGVGLRRFEAHAQLVELRVERVAHTCVGAGRSARDARRMTANARKDEAHRRRSFSML